MRYAPIALLLLSVSAPAQQPPPDPAAMQKAIMVLRAQRDAANDAAAQEMIKSTTLAEENTKLKAEIEALKKPPKEGQ